MHDLVKLLIFASSAFVCLFIFSRLLGKKQIAQLGFVDYAIGISLGSIAAEMAFDLSDRPFYHYILAMLIFFVLSLLINLVSNKTPLLKRLLCGSPIVIIYEGKIIYNALKKSGIAVNDLLSMMREKSYFNIENIYYAILEPSGELSLMPTQANQQSLLPEPTHLTSQSLPTGATCLNERIKDGHASVKPPKLSNYLIIDGEISYSGLKELGKDKDWLWRELCIKNKKQLKQIILASYSSDTNKITAHYK